MREQCDGKACRNDVAEKLQLWLWLETHVHVGPITERHSVCMWYQLCKFTPHQNLVP
jgi:hypothetical protein